MVTFTLARVRGRDVPRALARVPVDRRELARTPGLGFARLMGCAHGQSFGWLRYFMYPLFVAAGWGLYEVASSKRRNIATALVLTGWLLVAVSATSLAGFVYFAGRFATGAWAF